MQNEKTKRCNGCKKELFIPYFILDNKEYARCNDCRKQSKKIVKKNIC